MYHDVGTWADRNYRKLLEANSFIGHAEHATEELEKISGNSYFIESVQFLKKLRKYFD